MAAAAAAIANATNQSMLTTAYTSRLEDRFQSQKKNYADIAFAARAALGEVCPRVQQGHLRNFYDDTAQLFIEDYMNIRLEVPDADLHQLLRVLDVAWIGSDPSILTRLISPWTLRKRDSNTVIHFLDQLHVIQGNFDAVSINKSFYLTSALTVLEDEALKEKFRAIILRFFIEHDDLAFVDARTPFRKLLNDAARVHNATRSLAPTSHSRSSSHSSSYGRRHASTSATYGTTGRSTASGPRSSSASTPRRKKMMLPLDLREEFSGIKPSDPIARRNFCNRHKLCFDCFGRGHSQSSCPTPFPGN